MKVALVCEHVQTARGGAETSTVQYLQHLLARGIDVTLITRSSNVGIDGSAGQLDVVTVDAPASPRQPATPAFAEAAAPPGSSISEPRCPRRGSSAGRPWPIWFGADGPRPW